MSYKNRLFCVKNPYQNNEEGDELFFRAMKENVSYQYGHCQDYERILKQRHFHPNELHSYEDLKRLSFIPTLYFKRHEMFSMPSGRMLIKATSSGTSGKRSKMGFNFFTLYRGLRMVLRLGRYHHLLSVRPVHYLIFGYEPHRDNSTVISKTTFGFTFFAPALSRDYALKHTKDGYRLDLENLKKKLIRFSEGKTPVRTAGFPAYTYFLLKQMQEENIKVKLPKGSVMTLGGGWKQFYAEQISKKDFYRLAEDVLGIKEDHIIEFFGAVEHPILYVDCPCHHFHVPIYSRVIIRDADTLEPIENGKIGLVNLLTPIADSVPLASIMTDDLGILHDEKCPCGNTSPWLEIIGRVGIKDIVTCAAGASELLKEEQV